MKKVFIITKVSILLLAVALLISIIGGVSAAASDEVVGLKTNPSTGSVDSPASGETLIEYGVSSGYKLYVPADFEFSDQVRTVESKVAVNNITLAPNQILNVSVSSAHCWVLMQHEVNSNGEMAEVSGGKTIPYSMKFDSTTLNSEGRVNHGLIKSISPGTAEDVVDVIFELDGSAQITVAATCRDRLTFIAKIDTVNP